MSILFAGGGTFDILAKVPSETLLNMAAVIDHQFKKHTVHFKGNSRSTFPELPNSRMLLTYYMLLFAYLGLLSHAKTCIRSQCHHLVLR